MVCPDLVAKRPDYLGLPLKLVGIDGTEHEMNKLTSRSGRRLSIDDMPSKTCDTVPASLHGTLAAMRCPHIYQIMALIHRLDPRSSIIDDGRENG